MARVPLWKFSLKLTMSHYEIDFVATKRHLKFGRSKKETPTMWPSETSNKIFKNMRSGNNLHWK